jgi:hypothetical protein
MASKNTRNAVRIINFDEAFSLFVPVVSLTASRSY